MKYLTSILMVWVVCVAISANAQDSTGLAGRPYQESASGSTKAVYLLKDWYSGSIRLNNDQFYDGVQLRYDLSKDEIEYRKDSSLFRISEGVKEFTIPSGIDLYTFRSGFAPFEGLTAKSFYRIMYDGTTKLLKRYKSPIKEEKAGATRVMEPDALLYILKDEKVTPVNLKDPNSFLRLLSEEKNKMLYVIKKEGLEFGGDDDLVKLLEEYDSYKAGRGGN